MNRFISSDAESRGYLLEDFRLFHLKESRAQRFDYHYHEFDKVVVFLSGQVTYTVEGRAYFLSPGDLLLVPHHHIHQPDIGGATYERYILWLDPAFLEEKGLSVCFDQARETGFHILRTGDILSARLMSLLSQLEQAGRDTEFGHRLLAETLCLQFLIALNRGNQTNLALTDSHTFRSDPKIEEILAYINANLHQNLTIQSLAGRFYLSASWLMHRFKEVTGCTLHQYILQKRLIQAASLIRSGTPVMTAAAKSGFSDYSTFLRAFRNAYRCSPKEFREK
ncbi:MAG: helix-turn-helix domain-containing protein [Oscillospiraceae bacterium]|nr:helix-turn-helix domain-containing protein [Oscillospiraceae bacterium]